jgi:hypothetical protein
MSFNSYQQLTPEMQAAVDARIDSKFAAKSKVTTWYNPVTEDYWAANDPTSMKPDYGVRITKPGKLKGLDRSRFNGVTPQDRITGGSASMSSTEVDNMRYDIFTRECQDQAVNFYDRMDKARKQYHQNKDLGALVGAGTITSADYSGISNVMVDQEILELITREFVILDAVTRKPWSKLVYTFDKTTPFRNVPDLGELDVSPPRSASYARGSISLKKAQGHVSHSIWADLAVRDHDPVAYNNSLVDQDFERIFSQEVATALTGFTDQATAGAYDIIAGGAFFSTTNPSVRFLADTATIRTAGGSADTIVLNSASWTALIQNTFMRITGSIGGATVGPMPRTKAFKTAHQLLPNYNIFVDELATDDNLLIFDKRSPVFLEGPSSTRNVELNYGTIQDTVSDRWYGSGLRVSTWGVEETNIHS